MGIKQLKTLSIWDAGLGILTWGLSLVSLVVFLAQGKWFAATVCVFSVLTVCRWDPHVTALSDVSSGILEAEDREEESFFLENGETKKMVSKKGLVGIRGVGKVRVSAWGEDGKEECAVSLEDEPVWFAVNGKFLVEGMNGENNAIVSVVH